MILYDTVDVVPKQLVRINGQKIVDACFSAMTEAKSVALLSVDFPLKTCDRKSNILWLSILLNISSINRLFDGKVNMRIHAAIEKETGHAE